MTRSDIISRIAEEADIPRGKADEVFTLIIDSITNALQEGDRVTLVGFGTFAVTDRAERMGRNPQTGAQLKIPAATAVKFSPGKDLRETIK
jgi:DNA-binding protein HU-beta